MLVYYVLLTIPELTLPAEDDYPAQHCTIIPLANRARVAHHYCDWAALHSLERSAEDPREVVRPHGHRLHRHGGAVDDHSAPPVLCEDARRRGDRNPGDALWNRDYLRVHSRFLHRRTTAECNDVGTVFRSSGSAAHPAYRLKRFGD